MIGTEKTTAKKPSQPFGTYCNQPRLMQAMAARGLDGMVITNPLNVYYLSGFNSIAHKSDEPRPYAVVISRHAPDQPIMVIADYYLSTLAALAGPITNVHPFRAVMMPMDLPPQRVDIDRFIDQPTAAQSWIEEARANYRFDMKSALLGALESVGLKTGRIGFDDLGFGLRLGLEGIDAADAYDAMMFARAVKTPAEMHLLQHATALNQAAIERSRADWQPGVTWRQMDQIYAGHVNDLGGFVRDPGGMVWGHPRGTDNALVLSTGRDDHAIEAGTHVMFDCHGTSALYCWDGGKTWVVDDEPQGLAKQLDGATQRVAETMLAAMKPGARISELQALGRQTYRQCGVADADQAIIFFHGLGLSHMDIETTKADGSSNADWYLEAGMVVPLHLLYPGGAQERMWLEEVVAIEQDGGKPLFSWGFAAQTGGGQGS